MFEVSRPSSRDISALAPRSDRGLLEVTSLEVSPVSGGRAAIGMLFEVVGHQDRYHFVLSPPAARLLRRQLGQAIRQYLDSDDPARGPET